jgi:hypothetical protein
MIAGEFVHKDKRLAFAAFFVVKLYTIGRLGIGHGQ